LGSRPKPGVGRDRRVVLLAGGVGGAKLADGLQQFLAPGNLTVVVNTGDDFERHGLLVSPDHDTVMYTLAGIANRVQGWGVEGDTFANSEMLGKLGEETWFRLGDRDLAVHIVRTRQLQEGRRPTEVSGDLQRSLGVRSTILPMSDQPVRTRIRTDEGWLAFQEYFVRRRQEPVVREVCFDGIEVATASPEVLAAFEAADAVVIGPSNPIVSIGPILAIAGIRSAIGAARKRGAPVAAVSGIVGGRALRGPADRMLSSLGHEVTALGVARLYADLVDLFVIDRADSALEPAIEGLGVATKTTETVINDGAARRRLAAVILEALD
jgi:LPPG:FO 2-phospho-L-lactate transferase